MKNFINILLICVLAGVMTSSCGNDEEFVINCEIKGIGERGVEMIYFNRGLRKAAFHPVDDKVSLRGSSPDMTVVEVFTLDNQLLFTCVAQNGDELEVKMELDNPASIKVKGNEASEQYNKFVSENAELLGSRDEAGINALISKEISARPDKISSTLILTRLLRARGNELLADSLINRLAPEARPSSLIKGFAAMVGEQVSTNARGDVRPITLRQGRDTVSGRDTTVRFVPSFHSYSLLAFTYERKSDTITNRLRELKKDFPKSKRFEGLEISLQNDSSSWRLAIKGDSAEWLQAWDPGGSASPQIRSLAVPSTPFFIETDSTGKQLYRGSAVKAATDTLRNRLGKADISQPDTDADTDTK
ncbi:MAG: thioredoxin family protein, partial [Duncaniella sp.]|nr:thioredoxin family protein [Duncaniella sp.]